jgi:ribosomal protein S18 acetylase RimI-like enzyme
LEELLNMESSTYKPPTWRLDIIITLLGLLSLILFLAFYDQAFPSAAIDLDLSRAEIAQRAQDYLEGQGHDLQGYESALSFQQDWNASVYLQNTLGVSETNELIRSHDLPIYYWHTRWFRPLEKEEFSAYLSTEGDVVAFFHSILEDAPGAALSQDQARALAEAYLVDDRGWVLSDWEPVTASSEEQPGGRVDHYFEWKNRDFSVGEGDLRLAVRVRGDQIGSYNYWLRVPEAFQRHYSEQRNRAGFINNLSFYLGAFGFGLAALVAYLIAVWRGRFSWRIGLVPALAVAAVSLLAGLNVLPLYKIGYSTTQDYALFWLENLIGLIYNAVFDALVVFILWGGGQYLAKVVWPRLDRILPRGRDLRARGDDRWLTLARSSWRGLMLGALLGGYVVLFYLVATRLFGGWIPMDVPYTSLYATPFPFLGPIRSGLLPAMEEELLFRLVGIALLLLLTRRRWLALLVPGAIWAFAHLAYVRDPFYLRGIELTLGAIMFGLFYLRFDLTTTIVAHFAYNASLGALPLLGSGEPYFVLSGLIVVAVMLAPVVPGLVLALRRRLSRDVQPRPVPHVAPATPGDLPGLSALPVGAVDWPVLLDDPAAVVVCLRAGDQVLGAAAGYVETAGLGRLPVVYVDPAWRRRYWGSALVDVACAALRERGARSVDVQVATGDRPATAFWVSQGWHTAAQIMRRVLEPQPRLTWRDLLARLRSTR